MKKKEGIGLSRGGKNAKIQAVVDGLGNPVKLAFIEGNISDSKEAVPLLEKVSEKVDMSGSTVLGDWEIRLTVQRRFAILSNLPGLLTVFLPKLMPKSLGKLIIIITKNATSLSVFLTN